MTFYSARILKGLGLFLLLCLCIALLYVPGLTGSFVFDDYQSIRENEKLAIESLNFSDLNAAAWSGQAGPLKRPVSMLSFALNHAFSGFDPYAFKLTNLFIHLINTALVGALAYCVFSGFLQRRIVPEGIRQTPDFPMWGAFIAAAFWGTHPLNLTSVLYVVQRMTSLSTLFGLAALTLYGVWRVFPVRYTLGRTLGVAALILFLLAASVLSKESGLLFVPLLIFMELVVFQGQKEGRPLMLGRFSTTRLLWMLCALGVLIVLWKLPGFMRPENFYNRDFTLNERLLTEARVLFYYLRLFFAPSLSELALFHDDFLISTGLLDPPSTLLALLGLAAITLGTLWVYKKYPLLWFAWGWFLISHAMESTVISLELVHEHRNYFATLGFVILIPWLVFSAQKRMRRPVLSLCAIFLALCAFTTWQRANLWSDTANQALFEAQSHPHSHRAQFQSAFIYLALMNQTQEPHYREMAKSALAQARENAYRHETGHGGWFGALRIAHDLGETPDAALIAQLKQRLREDPAYNSNAAFLKMFVSCQTESKCHLPDHEVMEILEAGLENPQVNNRHRAMLYRLQARYALFKRDIERGEQYLRVSLNLLDDAEGHLSLARVLRARGKLEAARNEIFIAETLDHRNQWHTLIQKERATLDDLEKTKGSR